MLVLSALATTAATPSLTNFIDAKAFAQTAFAKELAAATTIDAKGNAHLWFNSQDAPVPSLKRCGEVDAAPFMPASLFLPSNRLELAAYAEVTIQGYHVSHFSFTNATKLKLGRCKNLKPLAYPVCGAAIQGIGWTPSSLMKPTCLAKCGCTWPSCPDIADKPKAGEFCSLCGRTSACPGCSSGTVTIGLCYPKSSSEALSGVEAMNIVQLAQSVPTLSTLVTAVVAGNLTGVLSSPGPFTVFAPNNAAFDKLPAGVLANLLKPTNVKELVAILELHVVSGSVHAKDLTDGEKITTVNGGALTVDIEAGLIFIGSGGTDASRVIAADNDASNGVVHIVSDVLLPGPPAPTPAPPAPLVNIVALAQSVPTLSTLVTAIKAAGLVETLSGPGNFTVFAPSNDAFANLPAGVLANLLKPQNKAQLVDLLTYHVEAGRVITFEDLTKGGPCLPINTVQGGPLQMCRPCTNRKCTKSELKINPFDGDQGRYEAVSGNGARDNMASNGVVHIISAVLTVATPLYFRTVKDATAATNPGKCAEVNAAPRIPVSLFDPTNAAELKAYEDLTIAMYEVVGGSKLEVGRCADIGYGASAGSASAAWAPSALMVPICKSKCNCDYPYNCPDQPDDPQRENFCSLCGPMFNQDIEIDLFSKTLNIVQLAISVPTLSTLVTALVEAKLTETLSGAGPFTVFAPNNDAFDQLPAATLKHLLDPANRKELVGILELHVVHGSINAKDLYNGEKVKSLNGGALTVAIDAGVVSITSAGTKASQVVAADNDASNGVVHIVSAVLLP